MRATSLVLLFPPLISGFGATLGSGDRGDLLVHQVIYLDGSHGLVVVDQLDGGQIVLVDVIRIPDRLEMGFLSQGLVVGGINFQNPLVDAFSSHIVSLAGEILRNLVQDIYVVEGLNQVGDKLFHGGEQGPVLEDVLHNAVEEAGERLRVEESLVLGLLGFRDQIVL